MKSVMPATADGLANNGGGVCIRVVSNGIVFVYIHVGIYSYCRDLGAPRQRSGSQGDLVEGLNSLNTHSAISAKG